MGMLEIKGLRKVFGAGTVDEHTALDGIDLDIERGQFVTVIGSNGAGKSTLFNAVCGNFPIDARQDNARRREYHSPPRL